MDTNIKSVKFFMLPSPQHPELFNSLPDSKAQRPWTHATRDYICKYTLWNSSYFIILILHTSNGSPMSIAAFWSHIPFPTLTFRFVSHEPGYQSIKKSTHDRVNQFKD